MARFPGYATAWAMLSLIALDEDRFAFNPRTGVAGPIERALQAARRAVDLDPDNARGLQALMMALFFHGEVDEAARVGELALAANPQDSELLSEFGLRIAMAGEWQRGRELVERALARDPAYSGYCHAVLALIAYMQRDGDRAEAEIRQANLTKILALPCDRGRHLRRTRSHGRGAPGGRPVRGASPRVRRECGCGTAQAQPAARGSRASGAGPAQGGRAGARGSINGGRAAAWRFMSAPNGARPHCRLLYHPSPTFGWALDEPENLRTCGRQAARDLHRRASVRSMR